MTFIDPFGRTNLSAHLAHRLMQSALCLLYAAGKAQWQPGADQLSVEEIVRVVETAAHSAFHTRLARLDLSRRSANISARTATVCD
jgi:hypothetical protein